MRLIIIIAIAGLMWGGFIAWGLYASGHSHKAICPPGNPNCSELPPP